MTAAIDVRGLRYAYPDGTEALSGLSMRVEAGERVALLGRNGAGKTTLLLHLIGLLEPDGGQIEVGGLVVTPDTVREVRRRIGLVFQDPDDQLFMTTVRDDVAFGPANYGLRGQELASRVEWALGEVGMEASAERAPHHLSVGERRRVALATVLAMDADVLVLDEPSANLDPVARDEFANTLLALDRTVLMVTHDLAYAVDVCDRALVMDGGRIVADGPAAAIVADLDLLRKHGLASRAGIDGRRERPKRGSRGAPGGGP